MNEIANEGEVPNIGCAKMYFKPTHTPFHHVITASFDSRSTTSSDKEYRRKSKRVCSCR